MPSFIVIIATAGRVECSCREISTDDEIINQCVIEKVNVTLRIGEVEERLHPECKAYKCVEENLVNMCGMGYNDENQYGPDSSGPKCTETKNPDCSVTVKCIDEPSFIIADEKTSYDISPVG
ncbi:hypothetical protein KP79_PYT21568 [Mizuhopecten yessoensis]|uniref:Uncharacterized protein n=1 Tax=Mizuhopecten yessoensis TaxID=6573 RepID=A0A210R573_MIZYE|nr:hypothetical protein KP79_PYT21568 [Mizuhopecten yessoensis]